MVSNKQGALFGALFSSLLAVPLAVSAASEDAASRGEKSWTSYCASCHEGAMLEAPRKEGLAQLPPDSIVTTLDSGIMSAFALAMTRDDMRDLAFYLTGKESEESSIDLSHAYCEDKAMESPIKPRWSGWGGDDAGRRFASDETSITQETAADLELSWVFAFPEATRARAQPTLSEKTVFVGSQSGVVYALDRESGCIHWEFRAESEVRGAVRLAKDGATLFFGDFKANAYAINTSDGSLQWKSKVHSHTLATVTGSVAADGKHVYVPVSSSEVVPASQSSYPCCTFRGAVVALDQNDGSVVWEYFTTDEPQRRGNNDAGTPRFGPSGAPVWSSPTIDAARNAVLITTGQNYSSPATGTSDAVISLDADAGAVRWIRQVTANDAWNGGCVRKTTNCPEEDGPDFDIGASAVLVSTEDGDRVFAGQKSGKSYGIDADTGELLWTRRVGRGGTMGGVHWGMSSDGDQLFVGVSDQPTNNRYAEGEPAPGVQALNPESGELQWKHLAPDNCPTTATYLCHRGVSAAISSSPGLVYAGAMDGWFRVLNSDTGEVLWDFNTARDFTSVTGVDGRGGAIESDGPVIDGGQIFLSSGYDKWGEFPGNVLLVFAPRAK